MKGNSGSVSVRSFQCLMLCLAGNIKVYFGTFARQEYPENEGDRQIFCWKLKVWPLVSPMRGKKSKPCSISQSVTVSNMRSSMCRADREDGSQFIISLYCSVSDHRKGALKSFREASVRVKHFYQKMQK